MLVSDKHTALENEKSTFLEKKYCIRHTEDTGLTLALQDVYVIKRNYLRLKSVSLPVYSIHA